MTSLAALLRQIREKPETIQFEEVMAIVDHYYDYRPVAFTNGKGDTLVSNAAGENEGSCKLFAFASMHKLSEAQTLHCFGDYYRRDVLDNPHNGNHANIRQFMLTGWAGIHFTASPLTEKR